MSIPETKAKENIPKESTDKTKDTKHTAPTGTTTYKDAKTTTKTETKAPTMQEHPDAAYIKRDDIGVVIAKGLAVMYQQQPKNPVDFLAKWLLNYAQVEKSALSVNEHKEKVKELKDKHNYQLNIENKRKEEQNLESQNLANKVYQFYLKINLSKDLTDQLQDLADFLKDSTESTAVYIGKLVSTKKPIQPEDDDKAHIDLDAQKIIQFMKATEGHKYMEQETLNQDQGLTFEVFKEDETIPEEQQQQDDEDGSQMMAQKEQEEQFPKHIYVKEVVREPKMHFYRVPKLGSYLAVKLEYDSCLFESALDSAVADYIEVKQRQKEQDEEKRQHYEKLDQEKDDQEKEVDESKQEEKKWEDIQPKPFETVKVSYVVCLNTMGQDREYTDEQLKFVLRTVREFRDRWEQVEKENLQSDIQYRIENIAHDKEYRELYEALDNMEMEREIEEALLPKEGEEPLDEETKLQKQRLLRFQKMTRMFSAQKEIQELLSKPAKKQEKHPIISPSHAEEKKVDIQKQAQVSTPAHKGDDQKTIDLQGANQEGPQYQPLQPEQWKNKIEEFKQYYVIKMPRVFQSLFYFFSYKREDVCEPETNKLEWKKAKHLINDQTFSMLENYNPHGSKQLQLDEYQKLRFIERNVEQIEPEQVDEYSIALGKLYRWLLFAIELRKDDVAARRKRIYELQEERQNALDLAAERERNRDADLLKAREQFEAELEVEGAEGKEEEEGDEQSPAKQKAQFDEEGFLQKWDADNVPIPIPDEVFDDIDTDYNIEELEQTGDQQ